MKKRGFLILDAFLLNLLYWAVPYAARSFRDAQRYAMHRVTATTAQKTADCRSG